MPSFFTEYVRQAMESSAIPQRFTPANIEAETMARLREDCERFCQDNARDMIAYCNFERAGREFWLSRNFRPYGFLHGNYPEVVARRLHNAAFKFGQYELHVDPKGELVYGA